MEESATSNERTAQEEAEYQRHRAEVLESRLKAAENVIWCISLSANSTMSSTVLADDDRKRIESYKSNGDLQNLDRSELHRVKAERDEVVKLCREALSLVDHWKGQSEVFKEHALKLQEIIEERYSKPKLPVIP